MSFAEAEAEVRAGLYRKADVRSTLAARYPELDDFDFANVVALAEQLLGEEFGPGGAGDVADQDGDAEPHASPLTDGQAKLLAAFEADEAAAGERARALVDFAAGLDDAGQTETARRCRVVARDVLELLPKLAEERSARLAMQLARNRLQAIVDKRGRT